MSNYRKKRELVQAKSQLQKRLPLHLDFFDVFIKQYETGLMGGTRQGLRSLESIVYTPPIELFLKEALDFLKEKYRLGNLSSVGEFNNSTESYTGLLKC